MKIEYIDFTDSDRAILLNNVGALSLDDIDIRGNKFASMLDDVFGKGKGMYIPVRELHDLQYGDYKLIIVRKR